MKGVPLRMGIGPRDLENQTIELARRDNQTKSIITKVGIGEVIVSTLEHIQDELRSKASDYLNQNTHTNVNSIDEMNNILNENGGMIEAYWDGKSETELKIKDLTKAKEMLVN